MAAAVPEVVALVETLPVAVLDAVPLGEEPFVEELLVVEAVVGRLEVELPPAAALLSTRNDCEFSPDPPPPPLNSKWSGVSSPYDGSSERAVQVYEVVPGRGWKSGARGSSG